MGVDTLEACTRFSKKIVKREKRKEGGGKKGGRGKGRGGKKRES